MDMEEKESVTAQNGETAESGTKETMEDYERATSFVP